MKRTKDYKLSELLAGYLRLQGLEAPLAEHRLLRAWKEVVGEEVASRCSTLFIRHEALHVTIESSVLRHHLFMQRSELVERLNRAAGRRVITDLFLH